MDDDAADVAPLTGMTEPLSGTGSRRALVATVAMVMLLIVTACVFSTLTHHREVHGHLINLSGRQRMLSQRIALMALWVNAESPGHDDAARSLEDAIALMATSHEYLARGALPARHMSPELHAHYFDGPAALDPSVTQFLEQAEALYSRPEERETLLPVLRSAESSVLEQLDAAVGLYEAHGVESLHSLSVIFYGLLLTNLVVVGLTSTLVYRPLLREISAKVVELEESSQRLAESNARLEDRVAIRTAELQTALSQRTHLLHELHHRVKNNLQIIASLIRLQTMRSTDEQVRESLLVTQRRVEALAQLHRMLQGSSSMQSLDLGDYLAQLVPALLRSLGAEDTTLNLQLSSVVVSLDTATPCGLLVNELVTNAIKYGRSDDGNLRLRVALQQDDQGLMLEVADEGSGFVGGRPPDVASSLGLRIVKNLGAQLDGTLTFDSTTGASVALSFDSSPTPRLDESRA